MFSLTDTVTAEALMSRLQMEQDICAKLNGLQKGMNSIPFGVTCFLDPNKQINKKIEIP